MFCTKCGSTLREGDKYCSQCAAPTTRAVVRSDTEFERLTRPRQGRKIAGVCAGLARYLRLDPTLMRVVAVFLVFWPVPVVALFGYILLWIIIPNDPRGLPAPVSNAQLTALR